MRFHNTLCRICGKLLSDSEGICETYIFTWTLLSQVALHLPFDRSFSNVIKLFSRWQDRGRHNPMHLWNCTRPVGQKNGTSKVYCTSVFFGHHDQKKVHTDGLLYARHFAASPFDICEHFHFEVFHPSDVCV